MDKQFTSLLDVTYGSARGSRPFVDLIRAVGEYFDCDCVPVNHPEYDTSGSLFRDGRYCAEILHRTDNVLIELAANQVSATTSARATAIIRFFSATTGEFEPWLALNFADTPLKRKTAETLRLLAPHLDNAWQMRCLYREKLEMQNQLSHLIDVAPFAVVIYDKAGEFLLCNALATNTLKGDGLEIGPSGLLASKDEDNRLLKTLVRTGKISSQSATRPAQAIETNTSVDLAIYRPSGKRPYCVTATHLNRGEKPETGQTGVALFIHDPEANRPVPYKRFKSVFNLTDTEARVATAIMQGKSLEECAKSIGHSVSTSRNLLKRVYAKTGTRRQNQLASLLAHTTINQLTIDTIADAGQTSIAPSK